MDEAVDEDSKAAGVNKSGNVLGESENSVFESSFSSSSSSDDDDDDDEEDELNEEETPAAEFELDELREQSWTALAPFLLPPPALLPWLLLRDKAVGHALALCFLLVMANLRLVWLMYSVLVFAVVVDVVLSVSLGK